MAESTSAQGYIVPGPSVVGKSQAVGERQLLRECELTLAGMLECSRLRVWFWNDSSAVNLSHWVANADVKMHNWRGQIKSRDKATRKSRRCCRLVRAGRTEVRLWNYQVEQGGRCDDQSHESPDAVTVNIECRGQLSYGQHWLWIKWK